MTQIKKAREVIEEWLKEIDHNIIIFERDNIGISPSHLQRQKQVLSLALKVLGNLEEEKINEIIKTTHYDNIIREHLLKESSKKMAGLNADRYCVELSDLSQTLISELVK